MSRLLAFTMLTTSAVDRLCDDVAIGGDVLNNLTQSLTLDFFALQIRKRVAKVKDDSTLMKLFDEHVLALARSNICRNDMSKPVITTEITLQIRKPF